MTVKMMGFEQLRKMGSNKSMDDEMPLVLGSFGDEQSTLLDQFERLSFEVQLNRAILCRSLSEPSVLAKRSHSLRFQVPPPTVRKGRLRSGFNRVLKMLLKPVLGMKGNAAGKKPVAEPINPVSWKAFSRSLRS
ncbi:hypothetical protein PTKIN_Ptkin17bG0003500 [Pterospermum kingtungense]